MPTIVAPICIGCLHFKMAPAGSLEKLSCDAFPDGIPEEIYTSIFDHHHPFRGDHDIQYESDPEKVEVQFI